MQDAELQADLDKCEFHVSRTKYLGFIVGMLGISVDQSKIKTIIERETPTKLKEVRSFLKCNFCRDFFYDYRRIANPLTILTRKNELWRWGTELDEAIKKMKIALNKVPIVRHFGNSLPIKLETEASNGVVAGVLYQQHEDGNWFPARFYSKSLKGPELNYPIHDQELLIIIPALETW